MVADDARTVLLEDELVQRVLSDGQAGIRRCNSVQIFSLFEDADDVTVQFDFSVQECPTMNGMLTLVSVTTFLAGFVAADFSGFSGKDWQECHWMCEFLYVCMLAYAEGSCLYIAICGTMACATHLRAANQIATGKWQNMCLAAVEPVTRNLKSLKGRRMKTIKAALSAVMRSDADFVSNLRSAGLIADGEEIEAEVDLRQLPGSAGFLVTPRDPVRIMGTSFGFRYLKDLSFPMSIVCYLVAQTMKALKGEPPHIVASVALIVGFWLVRIGFDLRYMYQKIYDKVYD
ncbi:unnamed protein product [Symbiodinium natans]|uniref:Uncharacterized protein n=1 Tax=Symbiodinium natans TaxID=878477 RepID=A0A812HUP0_9DINO|nr:unnamed protein product [Symbiodinium natans]